MLIVTIEDIISVVILVLFILGIIIRLIMLKIEDLKARKKKTKEE